MKCDMCGKFFLHGNRMDGTPNGVTFVLNDGSDITACSECIARVSEDHDYLNRFLEKRDKKA